MATRMRAKLRQIAAELRRRIHADIATTGRWLGSVVRGYGQYFAVPRNLRAVQTFRYWVTRLWRTSLRHRSQKGAVTWETMTRLATRWLPQARVCHPDPSERLAVMIRGRSPVRFRSPGSVRGAVGNRRPYRDF
jgi:hypothetical protein